MKNTRIDYIDTAKAILIILVVIGHVLITLNPDYNKIAFKATQAFIYAFHMPAFFIISGVLFNNNKWKEKSTSAFIISRIRTLIIPYLFFEVIGIVWRTIFFKQSFIDGLMSLLTIRCNVGADWFLPALFLGSLLFLIFVKHTNKLYGVVSTIACFVIPMFCPDNQFAVVIGRGMVAYGFIMIGHAGKKIFKSEKAKSFSWLALSFAMTTASAIVSLKWTGNDLFYCNIENPIILIIGGMSGTLMTIGISRFIKCKLLSAIGNHTLPVMGTHQLPIYAASAIAPSVIGGNVLIGACLLAVIVVFEIPVVWLIERHLPFCIGKTKLGKHTEV